MPSPVPAEPPSLHVAILAGGIGSRFWPASSPARPKPLLPLASDRPLIQDTLARARTLAPDGRVAVLAGADLVPKLKAALPDLPADSYWVEPRARGTAPVLAWAAHRIRAIDPDGVLISLHSDHVVTPEQNFAPLLTSAAGVAARERLLVTIAVPPDRPEIGYGYLEAGEPLAAGGPRAFRVERFIEKPDRSTAEEYVRRGYRWNSGIFILPVSTFLDEVARHAPEIAPHLTLLDRGEDAAFFEAVTAMSVDHAVFERSDRVGAIESTFQWDDVGAWEALSRTRPADESGNHRIGDVHAIDSADNIVWAEDGPVVLFGVEDLVVVRSGGVTMVTTRERSPRLKELLERLPARLRRLDPPSGPAGGEPLRGDEPQEGVG